MNFFADKCPHCGRMIVQRTPAQNSAQMGIGRDLERQLDWPRGTGEKMGAEDWIDMLIGAWKRSKGERVRVVPAPDGGFYVVYRQRKSRMCKQEASEFIEYAKAWAIDNGVRLSDGKE